MSFWSKIFQKRQATVYVTKPEINIFDLMSPAKVSGQTDFARNSFDIREVIFESQKAEGSSLSREEADLAFAGLSPNRLKSLSDAYNLYGHYMSWTTLLRHLSGNRLLPADIKDIHGNALCGEPHAGTFRTMNVFIGNIQPPKPEFVEAYINSLCRINFSRLNAVETAAFLHTAIYAIHPFRDGNKRTSRILMNTALALGGISPIIVSKENYDNYWEALEKSRMEKNSESFLSWVESKIFLNNEDKTRFVP